MPLPPVFPLPYLAQIQHILPCHAFPPSNTRLSPPHNPPTLKPSSPTTISLISSTRLHTKTYYTSPSLQGQAAPCLRPQYSPPTPDEPSFLNMPYILPCHSKPDSHRHGTACALPKNSPKPFPLRSGQAPTTSFTAPFHRRPGCPLRPGTHPKTRPGSPLSDSPPALVLSGQAPLGPGSRACTRTHTHTPTRYRVP